MVEKLFSNRFLVLYLTPFVIGCLTTLSFQPFNLTIINFIIFPLIFYIIHLINKKSKGKYRKNPINKTFSFLDYLLVLDFI